MTEGKDPYMGLNQHFSNRARREMPTWYAIGKILALQPLRVRADGLDLEGADLKVAGSLLGGRREQLSGLNWPVATQLPEKEFTGSCTVIIGTNTYTGTAKVTRPAEAVSGETSAAAGATHGGMLEAGDEVLLLKSEDGQTYYLIERLVSV